MSATALLTDNFIDTDTNTDKWTPANTVSQSNGRLVASSAAGATTYSGYVSVNSYNLTGSYAFCQLVSAGNQGLSSFQAIPILITKDASNTLAWYINQNKIVAQKQVAGVYTDVNNTTTYDSSVHKYFKIRESAGTIYWDYSTDGYAWTNYVTLANPFAITSVQMTVEAGAYSAEASASTAIFDNFNTPPPTTNSQKTYVYKVYKDGDYQGDLPEVESEFDISEDIQTAGCQLQVVLRKSFDDVGGEQVDTFLVNESGEKIVDESGNRIVSQKDLQFTNIPIDLGNRVIVTMYDEYYPNGLVVFDGLISRWATDYLDSKIVLTLISWGVQMNNYLVSTDPTSQVIDQEVYDKTYRLAS